jgi:CRP-like cAMP-binding protein
MLTDIKGNHNVLPANRTLYQANEPSTHAFIITKGLVRILTDESPLLNLKSPEEPRSRLYDIVGVGAVIGLHTGEYRNTAVTATETHVIVVERQTLMKERYVPFLVRSIDERLEDLERRLRYHTGDIPDRFTDLLESFHRRFTDPNDPNQSIPLPLTQDDFADLLHVQRNSIARLTPRLKDAGVIRQEGREYRVRRDALIAYLNARG